MKNFEIGKEIVALLSASEQVKWYLGDKIFPLIAVANTAFPFAVYRRAYYTPNTNKDYLHDERVGIEFVITATKYDESVNIANAVTKALIGQETDIVEEITLTNATEDFIEDTYIQRLTFEVEIKN